VENDKWVELKIMLSPSRARENARDIEREASRRLERRKREMGGGGVQRSL
jgi:hypothetical protein